MGTIEKRGENTWRVGFRRSGAKGREWVRRTVTFPPTMSEEEQRRACDVELARLIVADADSAAQRQAPPPAPELQEIIRKYNITPEDAAALRSAEPSAPDTECTLTVQQLYDRWMEMHCVPELKPTTVKTYRNLMTTRVLPLIGDRLVTSLTPMDIQQLLIHLRKSSTRTTAIAPEQRKRKQDRDREAAPAKSLSDRTLQHYYDTLSSMFDTGVQWEIIPFNPMDSAKRPKARRRKLNVLDDEQAVELLRHLAKEESMSFRAAVTLALLCGLRLNEVGALCWEDVNWRRGTITITRGLDYAPGLGNYTDTTKTPDSDRVILLPAGMMALLKETKAEQDERAQLLGDRWHGVGRIVCGWDGTPQHHDTPSKQFRKFADRHGFEGVTFHDLRHSHATLLFANNLDAVAVAHRMGHASPETTFRFYAHAIRSRETASANALQQYLDAATGTVAGQDPATPPPDDLPQK